MLRNTKTFSVFALSVVLTLAAASLARCDEPAADEPSSKGQNTEDASPDENAPQTEHTPETPPLEIPPKRELTSAMAALRDRVRRTLVYHHRRPLNTRENSATELMHACLAFGCDTEVYRTTSAGQKKINGIACLCWNYSCAGHQPLVLCQDRIAGRIGYGCQEHPSQLLAVLALSCVEASYLVRVGEEVRTVADLVESEKLGCRSGTDQSLRLIGLAHYVDGGSTWKNSLGEEWSVERIVRDELAQPIVTAAGGGTHRLMGLSYALNRRLQRGQPIDGQFLRAKKLVDDYHDHALTIQNSDGSWGPRLLAAKGASRNQATQLRSTGYVLDWLVLSLPEERLEDPRVVRAVAYLNNLLNSNRYRYRVQSYGTREIGSVMHALHALSVYDERVFSPADPDAPPPTSTRQAAR